MTQDEQKRDFDRHITRKEVEALAPALIEMLGEFVTYAMCRASNTHDRKSLVEKMRDLSGVAMKKFPTLKLNHVGAKTIIETEEAK